MKKSNHIQFHPLRECDLELLCQWFDKPHVKNWWDDHLSHEQIKTKYRQRIGNTIIVPFIIYLDETINNKPKLYFQDLTYDTTATFEIDDRCQFNELYGYVTGQQIETTVPSGEIAITSNEPFNIEPKPLPLNGELCLHSYPLILLSEVEPFVRGFNLVTGGHFRFGIRGHFCFGTTRDCTENFKLT